jgi:hypothetical protein
MVSLPEVESASSVSVRETVCDERTAASLVPEMLIVTEVVVPSPPRR